MVHTNAGWVSVFHPMLITPDLDMSVSLNWMTGNGNGLCFHMTQSISRSTIKAIACSKPTISEN